LDFNQITELPNIAFRFGERTNLSINSNRGEVLPELITESSNIYRLSLAYNPLRKLPEERGNLHQLRALIRANKEGEELPKSFYDLHRLIELDRRGTNLSRAQVEEVKEKLPNCKIWSDYDLI